jgi:hypothetical protein
MGRPATASCPLLFLVGGDNHRYLQKEETQKAVDFNFSFSFQDLFSGLSLFQICFISALSLSFFFWFCLLCFR